MIKINKEIKAPEMTGYVKSKTVKKQIVIGFSLRAEDKHIIRFQNRTYDYARSWSTYTISRNGTIYEHFDPKYYSNYLHGEEKNINSKLISITLSNCGILYNQDGKYVTRLNEECPVENVHHEKIGEKEFWEKIPDEQFESLKNLCIYLCDKYKINRKVIDFQFHNKTISKFSGIVFKSNYVNENIEINNAFDLELFCDLINDDDDENE